MTPLAAAYGKINHIETFGAVDGPGLRFVFFLQGCAMQCSFCHNPETWDPHGGEAWTVDRAVCEVLRYRSFVQGVTVSGGEPLLQPQFVGQLAQKLSNHGIGLAIDTAGAPALNAPTCAAIAHAELVLLSIKTATHAGTQALCGQSNAHAMATLAHCERTHKPVWIRHVLLPGHTVAAAQVQQLGELLRGYACIARIELLPFHQLGAQKWQQLGQEYRFAGVQPTSQTELQTAKAILRAQGFEVP